MPTDLPIACSLGAADLAARLAEIRAVGEEGLVRADVDGRRALLVFRAGVRTRVEAIVAAEAECCAFLDMSLRDAGDGALELSIATPPGGEVVLHELVGAFTLHE